jgi:riboflavin biosynthesis pyrimidine reductase
VHTLTGLERETREHVQMVEALSNCDAQALEHSINSHLAEETKLHRTLVVAFALAEVLVEGGARVGSEARGEGRQRARKGL